MTEREKQEEKDDRDIEVFLMSSTLGALSGWALYLIFPMAVSALLGCIIFIVSGYGFSLLDTLLLSAKRKNKALTASNEKTLLDETKSSLSLFKDE